jgi:hypothetical protein
MNKTTLLSLTRAGHVPIEAAASALSNDALAAEAPGMPGWTRKDVLLHLAWWHDHSAAVLEALRTGEDPFPDDGDGPVDTDARNARTHEEGRGVSPADARAREARSFARLIAAIEAATDEQLFGTGLVPWLPLPAAEVVQEDADRHYPEHVPHLA